MVFPPPFFFQAHRSSLDGSDAFESRLDSSTLTATTMPASPNGTKTSSKVFRLMTPKSGGASSDEKENKIHIRSSN
ncbi:unnamed protein product [Linum trigynum]|uniref:Uncharacterized protein n=1 Tax=Linum trigynum TaxID=586398 RepID=A0AAV2G628_9ROSI